jgi:hypothetical protein
MKLSVISRISFVFLAAVLWSPLTVFAQCRQQGYWELSCPEDLECNGSIVDGIFYGGCKAFNASACQEGGNDDQCAAAYASFMLGKEVTEDEVRSDENLRNGLRIGQYKTKDGKTFAFTPLDEVKRKIRLRPFPGAFNQPVKINEFELHGRFENIRKEKGVDEALRHYRRLLNNPLLSTPVFLEKLADNLTKERSLTDAIKVLELNSEINRDSGAAYFELAEAYHRRFRAENKPEDRENAILNYERVLATKTANRKLRQNADRRLENLRQQR